MDEVEDHEDTPATVRMETSQSSVDNDDDEQAPDKIQDVSFSWFCEDFQVFSEIKSFVQRDGDSKDQETSTDLELDDKRVRVRQTSRKERSSLRGHSYQVASSLCHVRTSQSFDSARFSIWAVHPSKKHGQKTEHLWTYRFNDKEKRFESIRMLVDVSEREIRLITNLEEDCVISAASSARFVACSWLMRHSSMDSRLLSKS